MNVPFYRHDLSAADAAPVAEVLDTPFLTTGAVARSVEEELRGYFDVPQALVCNSWTNGAFAALLALGVGPGDEVILPGMTFVACANIVELVGARPVFVDVDPRTLLMDLDACEAAVSDRTRVVMPVHLYGQMVDVRRLVERVKGRREDVVVLEDCAHAFEATYDGERPGRHGDLAIFSFYATKNVTCGEGGAIIGHDGELFNRLKSALLHGMSAGAADRFAGAYYRHWDVEALGTKANLPDLLAALLVPQIRRIDDKRRVRQAIVDRYRAGFGSRLRFAETVPAATSAHHLFPVHVDPARRDRFMYELNNAGIGTTVNYRAIHRLTYYAEKYRIPDAALPVSSTWGDGVLSLPLYVSLDTSSQNFVIEKVNEILDKLHDEDVRGRG
jgi:UDP-4-amino-4-deoxy-L-arabinose-oxoglutarate aminotransferase